MKNFKVKVKNIFCSFFKLKFILKNICKKSYLKALNYLSSFNTKSSSIICKALQSVHFNALHLSDSTNQSLFIKEAFVTKGRILKKVFPRAKGKTDIHKKHYLHLNIFLEVK